MVNQTRIAFRTDASLEIGTGHVMRCFTLAEALRKDGAEVSFILHEFPGNMIDHVEGKGLLVKRLIASSGPASGSPPSYAPSVGLNWQRDAEETRTVLKTSVPEPLMVYHYVFEKKMTVNALSWYGMRYCKYE